MQRRSTYYDIHNEGSAVAGTYKYEIAEQKVLKH